MNKDQKTAIVSFLRNKEFPRDVAYRLDKAVLVRRKASNISQLCDFVETYGTTKDCYVSLFSRPQIAAKAFDTMFFDIDSLNFSKAIAKAEFVLEKMSKFSDAIPRIYFSGHKGFHIYYDTETILNRSYSSLVRWLVKKLMLSNVVDTQVLTDTVLRRIVYTKNTFTRLWCVPIKRETLQHSSDIAKAAIDCKYEDTEICPSKKLTSFLNLVKEDTKSWSDTDNEEIRDSMPPCVTDSYHRAVIGTAQHCHRLLFAMYITKFPDMSDDSIMSMFKTAPDFVAKRTRYQLNYVRRRNVKVYGCRSIVRAQMCPLTEDQRPMCDWYPSINHHLPRKDCTTSAVT